MTWWRSRKPIEGCRTKEREGGGGGGEGRRRRRRKRRRRRRRRNSIILTNFLRYLIKVTFSYLHNNIVTAL
jgi:hypothetical protein